MKPQPKIIFTEYLRGYDWDSWIAMMLEAYGPESDTAYFLGLWEERRCTNLINSNAMLFTCERN